MATPLEIAAGAAVEVFIIGVASAVVYRVWGWFLPTPKRLAVSPFHAGVVLRGGRVERIVGPGAYWITPSRKLAVCDVRPVPFQLHAQELLTAERLAVRISLGGEYRISDPALYVMQSADSSATYLLEVKQALRNAVAEMGNDALLEGQSSLLVRIKELVTPRGDQLGIGLTQLDFYEFVPIGRLQQL